MPRMNILNTVEREAFESPPVFNSVQRKQYFDFPTELRRLAGELRAPTHQLGLSRIRVWKLTECEWLDKRSQ